MIDELMEYVRAEEEDRGLIEALAEAAWEHVENWTAKRFGVPSEITDVVIWDGQGPIDLRGVPAEAPVVERWDGSAWVVDATFVLDAGTLRPRQVERWSPLREGRLRVRYEAGFAQIALVPPSVRHAVRMLVGHWFIHREAVVVGQAPHEVPEAVRALLHPHRRVAF